MSRRCKPGQRARIISSSNRGAIVVVVRAYRGELIDDAVWPAPLFPWVITSLGAPLAWSGIEDPSRRGQSYTIVLDDGELEPLNDDDSGASRSTKARKPKEIHF